MARMDLKSALRTASRIDEGSRYDEAAARLVGGEDIPSGGLLQTLPMNKVVANPDQPRRIFDEAALSELSASIQELGLLQPILVRQMSGGVYQIVAGERRWRACTKAGMERIPALVQTLDDRTALEVSITENLQREDLTPLEEAHILLRMTTELSYSVRRLAERLGKGKGYVEDRLRLAKMGEDIQALVAARPDTLTHAREIEQVNTPELRAQLIAATESGAPLTEIRRRIQEFQKEEVEETSEEEPTPALPEKPVSGRPDTPPEPDTSPELEAETPKPEPLLELSKRLLDLLSSLQNAPLPDAPEAREATRTTLLEARQALDDLLMQIEAAPV